MNKMKLSVALSCALLLTGCSGFFVGKSNAPTPTPIDTSVVNNAVKVNWIASGLGKTTVDQGLRFTIGQSGSTLYVANANGSVSAVDANSGAKRWTKKVKSLYTGAGADQSNVYVATSNGKLIALNQANGDEVWAADLYGSAITTPVSINGTRVAVRTLGGSLETFEAASGEPSWAYMVAAPEMNLRGGAAPIVIGKDLLVPTDIGLLGLLNADTGAVIWGQSLSKTRYGGHMGRLSDIDAEPVVENGVIYAGVAKTGVSAISLKTGAKLWSTSKGVYSGLVGDGQNLYVAYGDGTVGALAKKNGNELWSSVALKARKLTRPVLIQGKIVLGDYEGYIHVLDTSTGQLIGSTKVGKKGFLPDVLSYNGSAIFQDYSGNIYRVSL